MAKFLTALFIFCTILIVGFGKHVHPSHVKRNEELTLVEDGTGISDIDGDPIEMIAYLKQSRLVPINNVLIFQRSCEDGFERDILGVCREVWE